MIILKVAWLCNFGNDSIQGLPLPSMSSQDMVLNFPFYSLGLNYDFTTSLKIWISSFAQEYPSCKGDS